MPARHCYHKSLIPLMDEVREQMSSGPVYISFDIDALDPSFAPGTGVCNGIFANMLNLSVELFVFLNTFETTRARKLRELMKLCSLHYICTVTLVFYLSF